jgi:hypothetical protein
MITAIATRSFLLKQEELSNGLRKDVMTKRGEKIQLTEKEAIMFWGGIKISDDKKAKELVKLGKQQGWKRRI